MKTVKGREFPVIVSEGGVSAKIRKVTQTKNGKTYTLYVADYVLLGERKQETRASFEEAHRIALNACRRIAEGQHVSLTLTNGDRMTYLRAIEPLSSVGVELDVATREYVSAVRNLPAGATLTEAIDFFRRRNPNARKQKSVREVVDEILATKQAANLSDFYLKDMTSRLNGFARAFEINLGDVTGELLQKWINGIKGRARTKHNYLRIVGTLFQFAIWRKYLPKEAMDEIAAVQLPKIDNDEVEIFTPEEMAELLDAARPETTVWLALGGFAGLRSAEIDRLDWSEIKLKEEYIDVKAKKSKTGTRRFVPISENLARWLAPYAKESGKVFPFATWWKQIEKVIAAVNEQRRQVALKKGADPATVKLLKWKRNALRHSFCSYRLAETKNAAQVALEAGNSPKVIFKHYRQVVTEIAAAKWFGIVPKAATISHQVNPANN
ncbi:MAG TPA: site-specific integrase [Verrucomicrobiae bacterium]|nr:site-specific integrase [Verrucomicrobiae bacterium]